MKQFLTQTFVALGVLFFLVLIALGYVFMSDSYGVRTMIFGSSSSSTLQGDKNNPNAVSGSAGFTLSEAQKQAIISMGIDPASVPDSVSPAQEDCFVSILGEARVSEIKGGAVPNTVEFMRAKSCI